MTQPHQKHPDDLFLITREELDRCCNQMSISGYKVSANYVEALVLSRPPTSTPAPHLPISLNFQPVCIDKPCIGQIDICPVDDECDTVKQCVEHAKFLRQNPDVAEHNRKIILQHDTAIRNATINEFYMRIKAERDPSLEYVDWDSVEAAFIRLRGGVK